MRHNLNYNQDSQIMYLEFIDDYLYEDVAELREAVIAMAKGKPIRQMLVDLKKTGKVENRKTREASNQILQDADITEIAFVGASSANRVIAKILLKTGMIKTKGDFFKTNEDAEKWLISKR